MKCLYKSNTNTCKACTRLVEMLVPSDLLEAINSYCRILSDSNDVKGSFSTAVILNQITSHKAVSMDSLPLQFDDTRLDDTWNGLHTPADRMAFSVVVMAYMDYVRSDPQKQPEWDEVKGQEVAMKFVALINNDRGWPIARQFVPEFQETV